MSVQDQTAPANVELTKAHDDVMAMVAEGKHFEAQQASLDKVRPLMEANEGALRVIANAQKDLLAQDLAGSQQAAARAHWTNLALLGFAVFAAAIVGWSVHGVNVRLRTTAGELKEGSEQVVSAANQVATSSQSLSQGAAEQAASLEETSASMEEMASMTRKNAENAHQAAVLRPGHSGSWRTRPTRR